MGLTTLMSLAWNTTIKNIALRRRPYFDHEGIKILRLPEAKADPYDILLHRDGPDDRLHGRHAAR